MIRIILYRQSDTAEWTEGVLHTFNDGKAIVEHTATGALNLVPITEGTLKFKVLTDEWVRQQVEAQQRAQAQSVVAAPNLRFPGGR